MLLPPDLPGVSNESLRRQRKRAEDLLDAAHVIVLVLDSRGRILRYNDFLAELSGRSVEQTRGADWFETFLPEKERARVKRLFDVALAGRPTVGHVNPITTAKGEERQIEWYSSTLRDEVSKETTGVLAVGLDVTDRLRLEEQFLQMQKMEAVGRLAGGIAHDFNTLLGSIAGYSEMLLEALPKGDPLRRAAEQISRCSDRGAELTGKLLAFSRRQAIERVPVDVEAECRDMQDMLDRLVGDDLELRWRFEADQAVVEADPGQIEQVVMNLVVNAADAMPRGGRIDVVLDNAEICGLCPFCGLNKPDGSYLHLSVRDTGTGMDEETLQHLFEPFFTTKDEGKGTGLGLSTVYGIVKQSGGCVAAESRVGEGSVFHVLLPVSESEASSAGSAEAVAAEDPVAPEAAGEDHRGGESILVVEDDEIFRDLIGEVLEAKGYLVRRAPDPEAALALVEEDPNVDLLVSDVVMPGMPGTELARRLRERLPDLRVLLMSGYPARDLERRGATETGSASCIKKPFAGRALVHRVRSLLDNPPKESDSRPARHDST